MADLPESEWSNWDRLRLASLERARARAEVATADHVMPVPFAEVKALDLTDWGERTRTDILDALSRGEPFAVRREAS